MCDRNLNRVIYTFKKPNELPSKLLDGLNLISGNIENLQIMGSYRQKSLIWAGDIDCVEIVNIENQAQVLKKIVFNLTSSPDYGRSFIIGDIKCGHNRFHNLNKYIGQIKNGEILNYQPNMLKSIMSKNYDSDFFNLIKDEPSLKEWAKLNKYISSFTSLRWSPFEINRGYKIIDNQNIDLSLAVLSGGVVKIDLYFNLYGKYVEITNILYDINKFKNLDFVAEIKKSAINNFYMEKYLKSMKNIYSVAKIKKDCHTLKIILPLLLSPINSLNSCISDLSVLHEMIKFDFDIILNRDKITNHIGSIILKLSNYYIDDIPLTIINKLNYISDEYDKEEINNIINNVSDFLNNLIMKHTINFIKLNKATIKKYIN
jgi:hypothetical protein